METNKQLKPSVVSQSKGAYNVSKGCNCLPKAQLLPCLPVVWRWYNTDYEFYSPCLSMFDNTFEMILKEGNVIFFKHLLNAASSIQVNMLLLLKFQPGLYISVHIGHTNMWKLRRAEVGSHQGRVEGGKILSRDLLAAFILMQPRI